MIAVVVVSRCRAHFTQKHSHTPIVCSCTILIQNLGARNSRMILICRVFVSAQFFRICTLGAQCAHSPLSPSQHCRNERDHAARTTETANVSLLNTNLTPTKKKKKYEFTIFFPFRFLFGLFSKSFVLCLCVSVCVVLLLSFVSFLSKIEERTDQNCSKQHK